MLKNIDILKKKLRTECSLNALDKALKKLYHVIAMPIGSEIILRDINSEVLTMHKNKDDGHEILYYSDDQDPDCLVDCAVDVCTCKCLSYRQLLQLNYYSNSERLT